MCQHWMPRKERESLVPLPFSTLSLCASGSVLCSFPWFEVRLLSTSTSLGSGRERLWVGRQKSWALLRAAFGPLSILSLPDSVSQHLNGMQDFLFSHLLYVTVGPFSVCRQWKSRLLFLGMSKCCWDTESGKPLKRKINSGLTDTNSALAILGVSSSCREHERVKQGLSPDGRQNLFNLCFNLHLLV